MPKYITDDIEISFDDSDRKDSNEENSREENSNEQNQVLNVLIFIFKTFQVILSYS